MDRYGSVYCLNLYQEGRPVFRFRSESYGRGPKGLPKVSMDSPGHGNNRNRPLAPDHRDTFQIDQTYQAQGEVSPVRETNTQRHDDISRRPV